MGKPPPYTVPSFPPPLELVTDLEARLVDALAPALGIDPATLRDRAGPAVTEALAAHVHAVEDRLLRAERLANVGQLSAGVAHELRNPLSVIETSVYILAERCANDARALRHLRRIADQVALAAGILNDLLDTARDQPGELAPANLAALARDAVAQVPRPPAIALTLELPAELPPLLADARRLRQVFVNLLTNAYQAIAPPGQVALAAELSEAYVAVTVTDSGPGIPDAILPRLFEPLFSTKRHGVGLGLAICRRIVEAHGGTLTAENVAAPGTGACFRVALPRRAP